MESEHNLVARTVEPDKVREALEEEEPTPPRLLRTREARAAAAASRRRKAEYPRRRREDAVQPQLRELGGEPSELEVEVEGPNPLYEDSNEVLKEDFTAVHGRGSTTVKGRSNRGRRSTRVSASGTARHREVENSRNSRSKQSSVQLVCKTEPDPDQLEYGASGVHETVVGISDDEDMIISEEDLPFKDDPKDETYKPHLDREPVKVRRKYQKVKEEKQKEIKVEIKEESEFREEENPPRRRGRRRKDDKSPRLPKRRKKPPIQYVRCEMEGCGTVLAHPRYLQHHIKYQHLLKKKYVCPHPSCGRLFRLQKQLLRHAKHHTDQRDYICEYCARAFKSSHNLAVHRMIHTGEKPLQCEICGFTCRQKASLNWHMKKHDADTFYQFSCNICGKKFEKKDSVVAHKAKSHPEVLIAEALAANAGALITSSDILTTNTDTLAAVSASKGLSVNSQGLMMESEGANTISSGEGLVIHADEITATTQGLGTDRMVLNSTLLTQDMKILGASSEGLVLNPGTLSASSEVLIEDSDCGGH
ncbi:E3 ubiquitin-protein ligase ZFP91 isoform X1 [Protopterus annectens]|uniref:E3 ubiquitin-protein ligase ZFP91 isoform X1 n=1 Tax=Protopterus annectens TaxID=7888 RepID=UPI001CFA412D|nr:E3 ubiquitin-protein ligase ZFP91 isoform X1 [Protopterus annectens]